jgi:FtsP/CotA-like multicopper oxidase with cupredoxin domain
MNKTRITLITGLSSLLILTAACSSNKVAEESSVTSKGDGKGTAPASAEMKKADKALVRFVNATTESKDLAFGDMTPFTNVGARDISAYKEVPAERRDFKVLAHDGQAVLATDSEGLSAGKHYTVVAVMNKNGKVSIDNISDDLTPPASGQAKVRVVNLAPGAEKVDLYSNTKKDAIISGAGLDHATDFKEVDPAQTELDVRHGMSKKNSAPVKDIKLQAGKLYTILVFQDKNGSLKTKTVEDQFTAAPNGTDKTS